MRTRNDVDLEAESKIIYPTFQIWYQQYIAGVLSGKDLVGAYILYYLGIRRPKKWSGGLLRQFIVEKETEYESLLGSALIKDIPGLLDILNGDYLQRKLHLATDEISLFVLFNRLALCGIKSNKDNCINVSYVQWMVGNRPYALLFHIPNPMEVLRMQARGSRVITLLLERDELARQHYGKLHYMEGMQSHARDAWEFLLHDMNHMEHFYNPDTYHEQIGFFRCMLRLCDGHPRRFFATDLPCSCNLGQHQNSFPLLEFGVRDASQAQKVAFSSSAVNTTTFQVESDSANRELECVCGSQGCDERLWKELEYAISDMNCYSTHLIRYVAAKMLLEAVRRPPPRERGDLGRRLCGGMAAVFSEGPNQLESDRGSNSLALEAAVAEGRTVDAGVGPSRAPLKRLELLYWQRRALERRWENLVESFGVCECADAEVRESFRKLLLTSLGESGPMDEPQAEALRRFFREVGGSDNF